MLGKYTEEKIYLSDTRPRTDIGPQGDHVTAYGLFREYVRSLEGQPPEEILYRLVYVISSVNAFYKKFSDMEEKNKFEVQINNAFAELAKEKQKFISLEDITAIVKQIKSPELAKKANDSLNEFNHLKFNELVTFLINEYLDIRNHQKYASFPQQGNEEPPKNEGSRVKNAVKALRSFEIKLNENEEVNIKKIVAAMQDLFWYPKIQPETLIDLKTHKGQERWKKIKKKYNRGTEPRNNEFNILYFVTAQHIDTLCACFPEFEKIKPEIIEFFVLGVAENWKMSDSELEEFLYVIRNKYFFEDLNTSLSLTETPESSFSMLSDSPNDTPPSRRSSYGTFFDPDTPYSESERRFSTPKKVSMLFSLSEEEKSEEEKTPLLASPLSSKKVTVPMQDKKDEPKSRVSNSLSLKEEKGVIPIKNPSLHPKPVEKIPGRTSISTASVIKKESANKLGAKEKKGNLSISNPRILPNLSENPVPSASNPSVIKQKTAEPPLLFSSGSKKEEGAPVTKKNEKSLPSAVPFRIAKNENPLKKK